MKIVIATPLYPPEIAAPAPYTKELAKRLKTTHVITIVAYTHIFPETIPNVQIVVTNKHRPLPIRLLAFTFNLFKTALNADLIFTQNGPSVELPIILVGLITRVPIIMNISDKVAHDKAFKKPLLRLLENFAKKISKITINENPLEKPEILPFEEIPAEKIRLYNKSWDEHLAKLNKIFENVSRK